MPRVFKEWSCDTSGTTDGLTEAEVLALAVKPDYEAAEGDAAGILNKPDLTKFAIGEIDDPYTFEATKTFTLAEFGDKSTKHRYDLSAQSESVVYPEGADVGHELDIIASLHKDPFTLDFIFGDGSNEPIYGLHDDLTVGAKQISRASNVILVKQPDQSWRVIWNLANSSGEILPLSITGSVDASSPYVTRFVIDKPVGGTNAYQNIKATITFVASGRTIEVGGSDLFAAPVSLTDSAGTFTLATTGAVVTNGATIIGGATPDNGDIVPVINGTLGSFEIVSSLANIQGSFDVTLEVTDSASETAVEAL